MRRERARTARLGLPLLCGLLAGASAAADEIVEYEAAAVLEADALLGSEAIAGEHFTIEAAVTNDGLMNRYVIRSEFQTIEAYGDSLARERAREQQAIAALRDMKTTSAYAKGLQAASAAPLAVTRLALTDPVRVLKDMPQGFSNLMSDVSAAWKGLRKGSKQDRDKSDMIKDLIGYSRFKMRLADELGVDPFSSNEVMQEDLGDVAWAVFAGGATVEMVLSEAPIAAKVAVKASRGIHGARTDAWEIPPGTLIQASIESLEAMGLSAEEAEAVAWHPTCTLTHQLGLVSALTALEGVTGRDAFARRAIPAQDETSCRHHRELAELIWTYHQYRRPLASLEVTDAAVTLRDVDGLELLPLRADYVAWTPGAEQLVAALPPSDGRSWWLSGVISERTGSALEQRGIGVHERSFDLDSEGIDVVAVLIPDRSQNASWDNGRNQTGKLVDDMQQRTSNMAGGITGKLFGGADAAADDAETQPETPEPPAVGAAPE
jgi:hypothetical protein